MPLVLVAALLPGCGDEFSPASLVQGLRVLAIQADSPEINFLGTTSLRALVNPDSDVDYSWSVCPLDLGPGLAFECIAPELECCLGTESSVELSLPALLSACQTDCALLDDPEVQAPSLPDLLSDMLGEQETADESMRSPIDSKAGDMKLRVRLVVNDGVNKVEAIKHIALSESTMPNTNPSIETLFHQGPNCTVDEPGCIWGDESVVEFTSDTETLLTAQVADGAAESYQDVTGETKESFTFAWYASDGEMGGLFTDGEVTSGNKLRTPKLRQDETNREMTLWLVVRDGRGGVDWLERTLLVVPPEASDDR